MDAILTRLAVALASALIRSIIDSPMLVSAASDIMTALRPFTSSVGARRNATSSALTVGELMAQALASTLKERRGPFDDPALKSILSSVATALDHAHITPNMFADPDVNPTELAREIAEAVPDGTLKLPLELNDAFNHALIEACRLLVAVVLQLPVDPERQFNELATSDGRLLSTSGQALAEVTRIELASIAANKMNEAAEFETSYRLTVARALDRIPALGLPGGRGMRLRVAYVSPQVLVLPQVRRGEQRGNTRSSVIVESVLVGESRLIIRGGPGSGKTTLLQWLAVRAASQDFTQELEHLNGSIPFFIPIRRVGNDPPPVPREFPFLSGWHDRSLLPDGWPEEQLRSGRALVLIDGFDEAPHHRQQILCDWLQDLVTTFPKARFVVTTRPTTSASLRALEFTAVDLWPFDDESMSRYIDNWYMAAADLVGEMSSTTLSKLAQRLKHSIRKSPAVRSLAQTPLQCAFLCALSLDRSGELPTRLTDLYSALAELLLSDRGVGRNVEQEGLVLTRPQVTALHEDLAFWLLQRDQSEIERSLACKVVEESLGTSTDALKFTCERALQYMLGRGIVQEGVYDAISFVHEEFQAYFAATAVVQHERMDLLVANAGHEPWRLPSIMAAEMARPSQVTELVRGILGRGDEESRSSLSQYSLAAACLNHARRVDPILLGRVTERLNQLGPPHKPAEALLLADAGDAAVPLLRVPSDELETALASVTALRLIGTNLSRDALSSYSKDCRPVVRAAAREVAALLAIYAAG